MQRQLIKDLPLISGTYCWFNDTTIKIGRSKNIRRRIRECADYNTIHSFIYEGINIEKDMIGAIGKLYKRVPRSKEYFINDDNGVRILELLKSKGFTEYHCPTLDDFSNWKFMSEGRRCDYKYMAYISKFDDGIVIRGTDQCRPTGSGWALGFNCFVKSNKGSGLFEALDDLNINDLSGHEAKRLLTLIRDDLREQNKGKPDMSIATYSKQLKRRMNGAQDLYMTNDIVGIFKELERGQL